MEKILIAVIAISFITSCTSPNDTRKVEYFETNLEFGNKSMNSKTLTFNYTPKRNKAANSTITINYDSIPFEINFDSCEKTGRYKSANNVTINKIDGDITPEFVDLKVDCQSTVSIKQITPDKLSVIYDLVFFQGYRHSDNHGYDVPLPITSKFQASGSLIDINKKVTTISFKN